MTIVAWPERPNYAANPCGCASNCIESEYQCARADAAMVALRIAEKSLRLYAAHRRIGLNAAQALADIGPLPGE